MSEFSIDFTHNQDGWGPTTNPEQYKNLPFAPYSKSDRCGRVADFTLSYSRPSRQSHHTNDNFQYNSAANDDEGGDFQLVDTAQTRQQTGWKSNNRKRFVRKNQAPAREEPKEQVRSHIQPQRSKRRNNWGKNTGARRWNQRIDRQASVKVGAEWRVVEEFDLSSLTKCTYKTEGTTRRLAGSEVPAAEDLLMCGFLDEVNDSYDRVTCKSGKPLKVMSNREFYPVSTTDDPVIERFAVEDKGNVFATDAILAHLMSAARSVYPWDIVVQKLPDGKIFFDKRDDSQFDFLTVSETSNDPPKKDDINDDEAQPGKENINTPERLSLEATTINQNFSQQILKPKSSSTRMNMAHPNPFFDDEDSEGMEPSSTAFRYRKFDMDSIQLVCRTELHGVVRKRGTEQYCTTFALNEWDSKQSGGIDWRAKIDSQRGAVLATELKNNSCKLAKWTALSLLSGAEVMKLGYVSRVNKGSAFEHTILGCQSVKPSEFAKQLFLDENNLFGVIKYLVEIFQKQPPGTFSIVRDPNKAVCRVYSVPAGTFDVESDDDDEQ